MNGVNASVYDPSVPLPGFVLLTHGNGGPIIGKAMNFRWENGILMATFAEPKIDWAAEKTADVAAPDFTLRRTKNPTVSDGDLP